MAEQTFTINIVADAAPVEGASKKAGESLQRAAAVAENLRAQIARAFSVNAESARAAAEQVTKALASTGSQAVKTQQAIARALERRATGNDVRAGLAELDKQLVKTGKGIDDVASKANNLGGILGRALSVAGVTVGVKTILEYADAFTAVQNRLRTVTEGSVQLATVTERLLAIANDTRQSFESTAELYARVGLSAKQLGRTQEELLNFTSSLNKAIILSGASAAEASAGLIQLSQGIASGALRGDELRSVLEQLPAVADVIAKQLGVTRGELRQLGQEGKITAQVILDAFAAARGELDERFGKTVPTLSQAFVVFRNNLIGTVGALNDATGVTAALAQAVQFVAGHMEFLTAAVGAVTIAIGAFSAASLLAKTSLKGIEISKTVAGLTIFAEALTAVGIGYAQIEADAEAARVAIELTKTDLTDFAKLGLQIAEQQKKIAAFGEEAARTGAQIDVANLEYARDRLKEFIALQQKEIDQAKNAREENAKLSKTYQEINEHLKNEAKLFGLVGDAREVQERLNKIDEKLLHNKETLTDATRKQLEAQIKSNVATKSAEELILRLSNAEEITKKDFEALALAQIQGAITTARYTEVFNKLVAQVKAASFATLKKDFEDVANKIKDLQTLSSQPFGAVAVRADVRIRGLQEQGAFAGLDEDQRKAVEQGIRAQEVQQELLARQAELYQGITGPATEYVATLAAANAQYAKTPELLAELQRSVDVSRLQMLEASTEVGAGFERAFLKAKLEAQDFASVAEKTVDVFASHGADALVQFAETGKFVFEDFARSIVADLTRIIARLLIVQLLSSFAGGPAVGAAAAAGGNAAGSFAGGRQSGGTTQPGKTYMVGEHGPEPFTPGRTGTITPSAASSPAAAPKVSVSIVNVTDKDEIATAINSGDVDAAIVNAIGRNAGKVNAALG